MRPITNPAELAMSHADIVRSGPTDKITAKEEQLITKLDKISSDSGFDGQYFVEAGQAFAFPVGWVKGEPVKYIHFSEGLSFEGGLLTYGVCKIGSLAVGPSAIDMQALSVVFENVTLLPFFDTLPSDKLLYVPAYAFDDIRASDSWPHDASFN